jgi:Flp pilus assembly protein CpaB
MIFPNAKKTGTRGFSGMTYRAKNLAIAALFAIVAMTVTVIYVSRYKGKVDAKTAVVKVVVAARDIPAGTPGSKLATGGYVRRVTVAQSQVLPTALTNLTQAAGHVIEEPIYTGEQVTSNRFASASVEGVQLHLNRTLRALQIDGTSNQLLTGTLKDGDHVDVLASLAYPEGDPHHYVGTVVRNLLVIRASQGSGSVKLTSGGVPASSSVLLAMTDKQAQRVLYAVKNGDWTLALRPVTSPRNGAPSVDSAWSVLTDGGSRADLLKQAAK